MHSRKDGGGDKEGLDLLFTGPRGGAESERSVSEKTEGKKRGGAEGDPVQGQTECTNGQSEAGRDPYLKKFLGRRPSERGGKKAQVKDP